MNKIRNILVVIDDYDKNKHVIHKSVELASMHNASLCFIKVVDSFNQIRNVIKSKAPNIRKLILKEMEEKISLQINKKIKNLSVLFKVREGIGFIKVIQEVVQSKHDLVIMGESKSEYPTLRSNTLQLIRNCPCPVWVMRNSKSLLKLRILIAVDIDLNNSTRRNVNNNCVSITKLIFENKNAHIQFIHVWRLKNEEWLRENPHLNFPYYHIDTMVEREKKYHEEWFNSFRKRSQHLGIKKGLFIKGKAATVIPEIIKKNKIDLLVMGTLSLVQVPGLLTSNRAETILQKISCSTITIKPDGFISPIT